MNKEKRSFLIAIITIFILMIVTYVLTLVLDCNGISILKFVLSPILVLGSDSGVTTIAICIFLLIIGGISNCLNKCGFIEYMLNKTVSKYGKQRYKLLFIIIFFFMALGALIGSFEEVVPIVPIVVTLMLNLGFDKMVGISISLLAVGCGFASGLFNPFNVGVAQGIAGLPLFSGVSLRLISFILIYILLSICVYVYAKKVDTSYELESRNNYVYDEIKEKALKLFIIIFSIGILLVLSSSILTFLQDYTIIIIALTFLISGILAMIKMNVSKNDRLTYFKEGALDIAPSIILILMAASIKYIMDESGAINTIVKYLIDMASGMNSIELILFIYFICLFLEVFVPSGSAKAFLLMPLVLPVAAKFGISSQLVILAYAFGDGFSNVFYPTNPALIICLGLVNVDYRDWFRYSWKFQLLNLVLTGGILLLGLAISY